jgi:hypothetical protein
MTVSRREHSPSGAGKERRLTANLNLYWLSLKAGDGPPALIDFNPDVIPLLWPFCLLAVNEDPRSPATVGDLGSALMRDWPGAQPGVRTKEIPSMTLAGRALGCLEEALSCREAARLDGGFRHVDGSDMLYRAIGLPFLDVRGQLSYVLCAASGKTV